MQWLELTFTEEADQPMVSNFKSYTNGFWKGLFTCYDHPHVPRTNNDHERFFRQTKTRHRRMTGLRSWNEYIVRSGEFVVFVDDALRQPDVLSRLQGVTYEVFHAERNRWSKRLEEATKRRRFRSNPAKYLEKNRKQVLCVNWSVVEKKAPAEGILGNKQTTPVLINSATRAFDFT